jgi:uncharacterized protein with von Willebrand factor type A (vWA) domain
VSSAAETLVRFGRALRDAGLPVGSDRIISFCQAAALADLYWAGRATLVSRATDIDTYDRVFRLFFGGDRPPEVRIEGALALEVALASPQELLREEPVDAEWAEQVFHPPLRRTRRTRAARRGALDLRRTLRRSFRTGGEPVERAWRMRRERPRRLVLLVDISGSMADHSRALLRLARAVMRADRRYDAFAFGTRLTRLSRSDTIPDWGGGTRIGESLETFLREHDNLARGAVVVICSDGLDVGDPELVRSQMARLHRLAHTIVWLNPLKADPRYEPLTRGMQAALPHVDVFAAGDDVIGSAVSA